MIYNRALMGDDIKSINERIDRMEKGEYGKLLIASAAYGFLCGIVAGFITGFVIYELISDRADDLWKALLPVAKALIVVGFAAFWIAVTYLIYAAARFLMRKAHEEKRTL